MRKLALYCAIFLLGSWQSAFAQGLSSPKDMTEVGAQLGALFVTGDLDPEFGLAYGVHIRKATDYLFSLRFDVMVGNMSGSRDSRSFEGNWRSGTALGVFSLNNVRFDSNVKKINLYALVGAGANSFETDFEQNADPRKGTIDAEIAAHVTAGAGISYRINKQVNISLEHQASRVFGDRSDLVDGIDLGGPSVFTDIVQFTSLQFNYNLGNPSNRSEPLYWSNLGDGIAQEIEQVKQRQEAALADTDQDGVIDAIDQEPNTPSDVPVDTKGRTLDSDKDGIADYKDLEPYYPPRAGEQVNEDGVVINPINNGGGDGVTEERVQEMIDEALNKYGLTEPKNAVAEWFLPMVHFGRDSYTIKYSDYGTLASVARMLKTNPDLRLVVTGYTDQTGQEVYNEGLSYQRSRAIIEHLANQHGVGRGRLVLQWEGQSNALVPNTTSFMNRRVEFRVADVNDYEMDPPANLSPNNSSGY